MNLSSCMQKTAASTHLKIWNILTNSSSSFSNEKYQMLICSKQKNCQPYANFMTIDLWYITKSVIFSSNYLFIFIFPSTAVAKHKYINMIMAFSLQAKRKVTGTYIYTHVLQCYFPSLFFIFAMFLVKCHHFVLWKFDKFWHVQLANG